MNYQIAFYCVCICFFIVAAIAIYLLLITNSLAKGIRSLQDEAMEQRRDFINFLEGLEQQAYGQDAQRVKLWSS